jgi:hypothetical protein
MLGKRARCNGCRTVFTLREPSMEDSVVDWLNEFAPAATPLMAQTGSPEYPAAKAGRAAESKTQAAPPAADSLLLRLDRVDRAGAFFRFPPALLASEAFRGSMPRCCARCGVDHGLTVNLVVWLDKLPERERARLRNGVRVRIAAEQLERMDGPTLLKSLPRMPNVPAPFNLPMPYYLCGRCSPAGVVSPEVVLNAVGGELCELGMASIKQAAEFAAASLGCDHDDYRRLAGRLARPKTGVFARQSQNA